MECFEAMLNRLFRDELEGLVMRYEALRTAMSQELEQRDQTASSVAAIRHQQQTTEDEVDEIVEDENSLGLLTSNFGEMPKAAQASPVVCAAVAKEAEMF